ncbi:MAG: pectate lyase [Cellulosilyticum sp.]|nr:pectate lyase [Cellulosilyticum sp.]
MGLKQRKMISSLIALTLLAGNTVTFAASGEVLLMEKFNDTAKTLEEKGYTVTSSEGKEKNGIQGSVEWITEGTDGMVYFKDEADDAFKLEKTFDKQTGTITASVDFKASGKVVGGTTPIKLYSSDGKEVAIIEVKSGALSYRKPNKEYVSLLEPVADEWYNIKVVAHVKEQVSNVYIDGKLVGEKIPFNETVTDINKIEAFSAGTSVGPFYLDNVIIYEGEMTNNETDKVKQPTASDSKEEAKEPVKEETKNEATTTGSGNKSLYEAEDAVHEGIKVDDKHVGFTGTGFADYSPNQAGGFIEWTVNVDEAGEYVLDFRYAHGSDDSRPAQIDVNGQKVVERLEFPSTGDFAKWSNVQTTVTLNKGENKIKAIGVGEKGGVNTDSLMVYPSFEMLVEAEDMKDSKDVIVDNQHNGFTGTGFIDYKPNQAGGYIEWEVDIPYETSYVLQFTYAHGANDERPVSVSVNGNVVSESVPFNSTGDWTKWQTSSTTVVLQKGKNIIRATGVGEKGGPNIDSMRIMTQDLAKAAETVSFLPSGFSPVSVDELLGSVNKNILVKKGAIAKDASKVTTRPQAQGETVAIESVDAYGEQMVIVTLDSFIEKFNFSDLKLTAAGSDWYSLNGEFTDKITVKRAAQTVNEKGQTVLIYEINETLDGTEFAPVEEVESIGDLQAAITKADHYVSWQMEHGGWSKEISVHNTRAWDGVEKKSGSTGWISADGVDLGTIDNDATYSHIRHLAQVYQVTKDEKYKESILKGIDFLFKLQGEKGGFAQVYPERGNYSDDATFNDNAMVNTMILLEDVKNSNYPFTEDLIPETYRQRASASIAKGIDYILNAQIKVNGKLTAWCAQHNQLTYEPTMARAYELPSISAQESVGVVKFLMAQEEQTPAIKAAIEGAMNWFEEVKVENLSFDVKDAANGYFVEKQGANLWYRFYELGTSKPFFSDRDSKVYYDIAEISEERRTGYSWSGVWPEKLLEIYNTVGYYPNKVRAEVTGTASVDVAGKTLKEGAYEMLEQNILDEVDSIKLVVDQKGKGDFTTVSEAISNAPVGSKVPVNIYIKSGTYKEVVTIDKNLSNINLIGEDAASTVLTFDNYSGREKAAGGTFGTSGSASTFIKGSDIVVKNITFENAFDEASTDAKDKQAVALYVSGERVAFEDCRFIGNQDTLYTNDGSQYFKNCYIEGDVDFIFGEAQAVFEGCQIHSLTKGSDTNNGYVTAASTQIKDTYGYLFKNCTLTSDAPVGTVYLGRPWHPSGDVNAIASVVFMNCELGEHINPVGWTDMSGFKAEDARFAEYQNTGKGVNKERTQLTAQEASKWTVSNVLNGWDAVAALNSVK